MTLLPQSNARLISVSRGGLTEDYDRPAGSNSPVWQGNMDAYVQQDIVSNFGDRGELNRVLKVTLFISGDIPITVRAGDTVVYEAGNPNNPVTLAGRVQTVGTPAFLAMLPDYYKCALEEIEVPVL